MASAGDAGDAVCWQFLMLRAPALPVPRRIALVTTIISRAKKKNPGFNQPSGEFESKNSARELDRSKGGSKPAVAITPSMGSESAFAYERIGTHTGTPALHIFLPKVTDPANLSQYFGAE